MIKILLKEVDLCLHLLDVTQLNKTMTSRCDRAVHILTRISGTLYYASNQNNYINLEMGLCCKQW